MAWLAIGIGLALLSYGSDLLVNRAVLLAKRLHISELLISMVIIGFGTSMPELLVSIRASIAGTDSLVIGNIAGSNIANILLVAATAGIIYPLATDQTAIKREVLLVFLTTLIFIALSYYGIIERSFAFLMLVLLVFYLSYCYLKDKKQSKQNQTSSNTPAQNTITNKDFLTDLIFAIIGLVLLLFGADLLVENAIKIAQSYGLSEAIIGLTLVAIGTSLPELATAIAASIKKNSAIVLGNVLGSNLMNILLILGLTSLVKPLTIDPQFLKVDIWLVLASVLVIMFAVLLKKKIGRIYSLILLLIYFVYIAFLYGVFSK